MTTTPTSTREESLVALARSALYALLARALAYPSADRLAQVRAQIAPLLRETEFGPTALRRSVAQVLAGLDTAAPEDWERAYIHLFTLTVSPDSPTWETAYSGSDVIQQSQRMADIAGFYRAHGLQVGGTERERPDHIATELEFLSFMARKEAVALEALGPEQVDECRRTQVDFLADHLGCWGPALGRRIERLAPGSLYAPVGALLTAWLEAEMAALDARPAEQLDQPAPLQDPDDDSCGPGDDCALACWPSSPSATFIAPQSIR